MQWYQLSKTCPHFSCAFNLALRQTRQLETVAGICWNQTSGQQKRSTSNMFSAQMNGHGKLSRDKKCWEQTSWCLSVTTSALGDNVLQKIPTAPLKREIQPTFNRPSFECFLNERRNLLCSVKYCCILSIVVHTLPWEICFSQLVQTPNKYFKVSGWRGEDSCLSQSKNPNLSLNLWLRTLYNS